VDISTYLGYEQVISVKLLSENSYAATVFDRSSLYFVSHGDNDRFWGC